MVAIPKPYSPSRPSFIRKSLRQMAAMPMRVFWYPIYPYLVIFGAGVLLLLSMAVVWLSEKGRREKGRTGRQELRRGRSPKGKW